MSPVSFLNSLLFAAYAATSSIGLLLLKRSLAHIRATGGTIFAFSHDVLMASIGFTLYVVSFIVWTRILARMPLSVAYPIAIGLTLAFSIVGAVSVLGERLGALKLAGIFLIFLGTVAISLDSK